MSEFLENNITNTGHNNDRPNFINIIPYLNELFQKNSLYFFTKEELTSIAVGFSSNYRPSVFMENEIVENNFRMIESYLPELLYVFSTVSNPKDSITKSIQKLSKKPFPYPKPAHSQRYLQHKIVVFIETILFADIFNDVWKGNFDTSKCYVYKENTELEYYHYYQVRALLVRLLDKISIHSSTSKGNGITYINIAFQLLS